MRILHLRRGIAPWVLEGSGGLRYITPHGRLFVVVGSIFLFRTSIPTKPRSFHIMVSGLGFPLAFQFAFPFPDVLDTLVRIPTLSRKFKTRNARKFLMLAHIFSTASLSESLCPGDLSLQILRMHAACPRDLSRLCCRTHRLPEALPQQIAEQHTLATEAGTWAKGLLTGSCI